jgi:hypothetical protein
METKGKIMFERNTVANNVYISPNVGAGGGLCIFGDSEYPGEIMINRNLIINNESKGGSDQAYGYGGGVYIEGHNPVLTNNIITGNKSGDGGGVFIGTWSGNDRTADPVLINNTLTRNESRRGGGIYMLNSNATVINTISWDNQATVNQPEIYRSGGTINVYYSDIAGGWSGEGNLDTDPCFCDTFCHLADSSFCIGRGIDSLEIGGVWYHSPLTDFDGRDRPYLLADEYVDIGALESTYPQVSAIESEGTPQPQIYQLSQNYPNPFNPRTVIRWQLAGNSNVELSIYNLLGQKVATLVNKKQHAGTYQVEWDASAFASGVYYYKIEAGEFQDVKKMILLR